jgi:hypothetical protein
VSAALIFGPVAFSLLAAHAVADHWVQTGHQAATKGQRGRRGSLACAAHVASYTAVTAGFVALVWAVCGLHISPAGFLAGQAVSAVTHYWADRRYTLAWLARVTGRETFYGLGTPRAGRDDNPSLGTGAYALDQSYHLFWLFAAALVTVAVAA